MLGVLLTEKEGMELEFLIKKELDDIRNDEKIKNHHPIVQRAIEERYKLLLKMLIKIAPKSEYLRYLNTPVKAENNFDEKC